jgi:hypothetical protein
MAVARAHHPSAEEKRSPAVCDRTFADAMENFRDGKLFVFRDDAALPLLRLEYV